MIKTNSPLLNMLQKKVVERGIRSVLHSLACAIALADVQGKKVRMNYRDNPLSDTDLRTVLKNLSGDMY